MQSNLGEVFHRHTKRGHASSDPQELDFMGEIKRSAFVCKVGSRSFALPAKDTSTGSVYFSS